VSEAIERFELSETLERNAFQDAGGVNDDLGIAMANKRFDAVCVQYNL